MTIERRRSEWIVEALALRLNQHRDEPATLAQRLYTPLRGWIQQGELTAGEALPSSRRLARALGIGRNTVLTAMERLAAEGFVVARQGAGLSVADLGPLPVAPAPRAAMVEAPPLSGRGQRLLDFCATLSGGHRAFAPGVPALDLFPRERWQRLLRRHQQRSPTDWFDYRSQGGLPALKSALCDYLRLSRSVRCHPEQILITQGAQQGFELITRLLADAGDTAWIEEPGYGGAQACFAMAGLAMQPIPVDAAGIDPEQAAGPPPRLIYVTPSHQYPLGVTLSLNRRLALLKTAERHRAWLIEDDYDSEFRYTSAPLASLQGLAEGAPVIYVGTFSKVLYPGLRLGYLVLPEPLVEVFRRASARLHREGQYVVQAALAEFIEAGHFARHVARMKSAYRQRQAWLRQALAPAVAQGLELSSGHAGMHLVARLASLEQEQRLVDTGHAAEVALSPLSRYYLGPGRPGLVLGYAGSDEGEIARAGGWLSRAWLDLRSR
ncbi:PLP-dependent aminotransferase family protein [Halomonas sp. HP20-15]|uniref:MocR-like pyridoxine biosynthesis transcription factor PdxR n=1 Tax=Halomonas sp. HP20-15 TaxID=3085901 RepID=UPI002981D280|nr:PLP-dependent aminotransferase family protein [Halomonas sp. HP20-15]MDW5376035.1 PLP-dependent aminotransferase family protein [Halomonas sp. HP20-15]